MLESKHIKDHLKLWDIHYSQQLCYPCHSEISTTEDPPCLHRSQSCSCLGGCSETRISTRTIAITKNSPSCFYKCQLYFLAFAFLLCSDCDAAIHLKNGLALFMATKWDGTCDCQDATLSRASQYWQSQLPSSILATPTILFPIIQILVIYIDLHSRFSLKTKQKTQKKNPNNIPSYSGRNGHCTLHIFSTGKRGKSKHHRCYSES